MKDPIVKFKNIKTFQGIEDTGVNADVYINGVKCYFMIDSGDGGETNFRKYHTQVGQFIIDANVRLLDEYIAQLPLGEYGEVDLEEYVNNIYDDMVLEKIKRQASKRALTCIVIGKPDFSKPYSFFQLKKPLKDYLPAELQQMINLIAFRDCNKGVQILNKNLEVLGVNMKHAETLYKA